MDEKSEMIQFYNCNIIRNHRIIRDDLWVYNGIIINPEPIFFNQKRVADVKIDCQNMIIAPGYIDMHINGAFGYDFSDPDINIDEALRAVSVGLLKHGVTSLCPTVVTQTEESYDRILPHLKRRPGNKENGATNLGVHLEGPFISYAKRGAHPEKYIKGETIKSVETIINMYKHLDDVSIITIAPELDTGHIIRDLTSRGIMVSLGHSVSTLSDGERAFNNGANCITHLYNAMLLFNNRDTGLFGLLTSDNINKQVFYSIIADGVHTHSTALKIAYKSNPNGMILITDAVSSTGLESGIYRIGLNLVEVKDNMAVTVATNTLCGSIATIDKCVQNLRSATGCSKSEAIECATLHPAEALGISNKKGTLNFGSDADFILLDDTLNVLVTIISGKCVWKREDVYINI